MTLDSLPLGQAARISAVEWTALADDEGQRLRALGFDIGAEVAIAHRGVFGGPDPLAISIGRMTVALRRSHARAMTVEVL
ncbi:MAG: ferrous iron transport protein A [Novosphingobium sp.]|jgi:ferrous iron transport protein A|nr:FeoA family protein [Brevundimonas sp.]MCZ8321597.1 FeoA family protein [Novosphingobium sp.]